MVFYFPLDEDYVPAKISLNNDDSVEVDVRLKGELDRPSGRG